MNDAIIIIPARSGSKTIKDKNLLKLNNHPLIAYSIAIAKLVRIRVIVSTDSQEYANVALKYGAEVPFLRPKSISHDESLDIDFVLHAMNWLRENENNCPEYWIHLRPTTPLRKEEDIHEALYLLSSDKNATSLRSAHISPESPYKWFKLKDEKYFVSGFQNKNIPDEETYNQPKEKFEQIYIPDGYIDILRSSHVLNNNNLHGNRILSFISPDNCTEVDSYAEFKFIEYTINQEKNSLLKYLEQFQ